jgi:acetyl esterase/lipase
MSRSIVVRATLPALALLLVIGLPGAASAQLGEQAASAALLMNDHRVVADVTYLTAGGWDNKLDLYLPRNPVGPTPVVIYFHGGFWVRGSRHASALNVLPYLGMGWAAVNVSYRLGAVANAPAAVEDVLCAVRWVMRNAAEYGLDASRIVVTGHSAGGHLALASGMIPESAGLEARCPASEPIRVAGIVNWYGPTAVGDFLEGAERQNAVVEWLGTRPDRFEVAARVSPLGYIRSDLPPILTIHGDADRVVPYHHATRLHQELSAAGARHELHTVPGGGHGGFTAAQTIEIFERIERFLSELGEGGTR